MKKTVVSTSVLCVCVLIVALLYANNDPESPGEYEEWMRSAESNLNRTHKSDGLQMTLQYLPIDVVIHREMRAWDDYSLTKYEQLSESYSNHIAVELSFTVDLESAEGDVIYKDVMSYNEYSERVKMLNFGLEQLLELRVGDEAANPLISSFDNTYGIADRRVAVAIFSADLVSEGEHDLDFVFNDEVFGSGIHHFRIKRENINSVPKFPFDINTSP